MGARLERRRGKRWRGRSGWWVRVVVGVGGGEEAARAGAEEKGHAGRANRRRIGWAVKGAGERKGVARGSAGTRERGRARFGGGEAAEREAGCVGVG